MSLTAVPSDARRRLPNRRHTDLFDLPFRNNTFTIGVGAYPGTQEIAEVFIHSHKLACDAAEDARDIAVLLSIARQHGVPFETMRDAVCRFDDGSPAGLAGAVLDKLCESAS